MKNQKGFTLLEILLVVAALSILAAITIVAINPTKQLGDTRNAQRRSDVNTLINAIYQYAIDHDGDITALGNLAPAGEVQIFASAAACPGTPTCGAKTVTGCVDMEAGLVEDYIVDMPTDPRYGSIDDPAAGDYYSDYYVDRSANGRITVGACTPEGDAPVDPIEIKR